MSPEAPGSDGVRERTEGWLRSSRIGILAGAVMLLLLSAGAFLGFYLLPLLQVKAVLNDSYIRPFGGFDQDGVIKKLGGQERAAKRIKQYLHSPNWLTKREDNWWASVTTLGGCGKHGVSELVALLEQETLDGKEDEGKVMILGSLEAIGPEARDAIPAIIRALRDSSAMVRNHAAMALSNMPEGAAPALRHALLNDEDDCVRGSAAGALGVIGAKEGVVPDLIRALQTDDDQLNRQIIIEALGRIGPDAKEALPVLERLSNDTNPDVRKAAAEALKKIRGEGGAQ